MKNIQKLVVLISMMLLSHSIFAVPWCHKGNIVTVADISMDQSQIESFYVGLPTLDIYMAAGAMDNYMNTYFTGNVITDPYAPSTYLSSNGYSISQGVSFYIKRCYPNGVYPHVLIAK